MSGAITRILNRDFRIVS